MKIIVGLTGASGSLFGVEFLKKCPAEKYLICSEWGEKVLKEETGLALKDLKPHVEQIFSDDDLASPFSSGSNPFDAMVIVPCSANTMAKIASGIADTLMTRAASVALKERRRLVLCLRETPLSSIMLENALKLSHAGAVIMPISPAFYHQPKTPEAMAALFAERISQVAGVQTGVTAWNP